MACSSCHRAALGSPSPGATDVTSQIVNEPVQMFTPAQYAANFPATPWYKTPLGMLGILAAFGGLFYFVRKR